MQPLRALLSAAVFAATAHPAGALELELRDRVQVGSDRVRLGDVARVRGDDADTARAAESLSLGAAPRFGEELRLDRHHMARWLQRNAPALGQVHWAGAEAVRIVRAGQALPEAEVCAAAEQAVLAAMAPTGERPTIRAECGTDAWTVPVGRIELRPRNLAEGQWPARRQPVFIDVWVDGQFARTTTVSVRVEAVGTAWVARRDMHAMQPLAPESLELREVDLAGLPAAPWPASTSPASGRLRRALRSGQVLTAGHVESIPDVSRGQRVRLVSRSGLIAMEASGEALQDGRQGDMVLVRLTSTGAPLATRVVGSNQVELRP